MGKKFDMNKESGRYRQILYDEDKNDFSADSVEAPGITKKVLTSAQSVILIISEVFGVSVKSIFENTRKRELVYARMIFFYWMRDFYPKLGFKEIGSFAQGKGYRLVEGKMVPLGKDHATVLHALGTLSDLREAEDKQVCGYFKQIESQILSEKLPRTKLENLCFSYEEMLSVLAGNGVLDPFFTGEMFPEKFPELIPETVA